MKQSFTQRNACEWMCELILAAALRYSTCLKYTSRRINNYNSQFRFVCVEFPPHILCIQDALACIESTPMRPVHTIMHVWALLGWRDYVIVAYVNRGLTRLVLITWQWVFELKFEDTTQCMCKVYDPRRE